jgi:hypothetical protein
VPFPPFIELFGIIFHFLHTFTPTFLFTTRGNSYTQLFVCFCIYFGLHFCIFFLSFPFLFGFVIFMSSIYYGTLYTHLPYCIVPVILGEVNSPCTTPVESHSSFPLVQFLLDPLVAQILHM